MPKEITFKKYQTRQANYHWQQISPSIFHFNAYVVVRYQQVINIVPKNKNLKILDIGCGDGVLLWLISQKTPAKLFGIDTNKQSLRSAQSKLGDKATFKPASAYKLPFKSNQFDVITAAEIIEHLGKPEKMLQEIQRVLKPSGQVIITTPVKLSDIPEDKMHVQEFTVNDLKNLLSQYFKKVKITTSHPVWLKKLYTLTFFKLDKYHFDVFRWLINLLVLLTGYNPFKVKIGHPSQQIAICQNTV